MHPNYAASTENSEEPMNSVSSNRSGTKQNQSVEDITVIGDENANHTHLDSLNVYLNDNWTSVSRKNRLISKKIDISKEFERYFWK